MGAHRKTDHNWHVAMVLHPDTHRPVIATAGGRAIVGLPVALHNALGRRVRQVVPLLDVLPRDAPTVTVAEWLAG